MGSLLIQNGRVVTLNDRAEILLPGSVYIKGANIVEAGEFPAHKHKADRVIDAGGKVVMPGLINAHHKGRLGSSLYIMQFGLDICGIHL